MSRLIARLSGLAIAVAAGIVLVPAPAHAAATAVFGRDSTWPTGYVGRMTVANNTATPMPAWRVEFDLPAGTTVSHHWNATLTRTGTRHVFTGPRWQPDLAPGASADFGWVAAGSGVPQGCRLNDAPCDGPPARDVQPPSTPTGFRSGTQDGLMKLEWDASSDDSGVTGYEIFTNSGSVPVATVTGTSHLTFPPPPVVMSFGVRAVDAAGNRSPFAQLGLGTGPDTTAPGPPANLTLSGPADGFFTVGWDPARDDQFVAGYEVSLNGRVVTRVGNTSTYVPYTGFGTYLVAVRAFDGAGNHSTPVRIGIAIDPPPITP